MSVGKFISIALCVKWKRRVHWKVFRSDDRNVGGLTKCVSILSVERPHQHSNPFQLRWEFIAFSINLKIISLNSTVCDCRYHSTWFNKISDFSLELTTGSVDISGSSGCVKISFEIVLNCHSGVFAGVSRFVYHRNSMTFNFWNEFASVEWKLLRVTWQMIKRFCRCRIRYRNPVEIFWCEQKHADNIGCFN